MTDWLHHKAKTAFQWIGFDFVFRILVYGIFITLGILFLPRILPSLYLVNMNQYAWALTIVLSIGIVLWAVLSYRRRRSNYQDKLSHHHYKHKNHQAKKSRWITFYKVLISAPITAFFCLVFLPALLQHFAPIHNIFVLIVSAFIYPFEFVLIEGHSFRNFFWQSICCLWILMITYTIRSFVFPLFISTVLAASQLYSSKQIV
ncbi:MAG: hypothetical protein PHI40_06690 [Caldisericia bacterium]|nr:hypothetical protein [Caldisericia bacterium]